MHPNGNPFTPTQPVWPQPSVAAYTPPANAAIDQTTGEMLHPDRDTLLFEWKTARDAAETAKTLEQRLRKLVVAAYTSPDVKKGTERVELGDGWQLKTVKKETYTLADAVKVSAALSAIEARSKDGAFITERLVRWTPELVMAEYKLLNEENLELISEVLTIKQGMPTVEIVAPKTDK